ncbi:MAG TPA: GspH/FimT family pseudopilin [Gemmatimonadaceae bacterium]|nr:GspH/FimT family pseudopilin [Gemmatimonadaceae bacterium]
MRQQCARVITRRRRSDRAAGFSMIEMLLVLIVLGILITIVVTKTSRIMRHERVNRATQVLVQDLQNGFAMAGRQRAPVRLTITPTAKTYKFTDRLSGTTYLTRTMSSGTEWQLSSLTATATTVDILPNGIGSTPFSVTLALGDYSRTVTASSAGFVRSRQ